MMIEAKVRLSDMKDIEKLCAAAVEQPFDIDIVLGNYIIDAKSIMGIFSLDRSAPLGLQIHAEQSQASAFLHAISSLIA